MCMINNPYYIIAVSVCVCVCVWFMKKCEIDKIFLSSFFVLNSKQFSNESLKEATEFSLRKKMNNEFFFDLWLKNIFPSNVKSLLKHRTIWNIYSSLRFFFKIFSISYSSIPCDNLSVSTILLQKWQIVWFTIFKEKE